MGRLFQQGEFDPRQLDTLLGEEELAAYHAQRELDNDWQATMEKALATPHNEKSIQGGSVWSEERYDPVLQRRPSCASDRTS
jgi:hypothetical protein